LARRMASSCFDDAGSVHQQRVAQSHRNDSGAIQARWRNPRNVVPGSSGPAVPNTMFTEAAALPARFTVRVALSQADRPAAATRTPGTPRRLTTG
jgi:hypothetical protein